VQEGFKVLQCLGFTNKTISANLFSGHCNMYRNTRFFELLKVLPKPLFNRCVQRYRSDKHNKGFNTWDQMLSLIFAQLSGCRSLRELEVSYNSLPEHHYHLGCDPIKRSTLSDANRNRDAGVFEAICQGLLTQTHRRVRKEIKALLYLLDSTPICLRGRGYEWTESGSMSRVPGLKLHVLFSPDANQPCEAMITPSSVNDIEEGREVLLESGAKYVFDKGYCDYGWWWEIDRAGAYFVTRLKRNAAIKVVKSHPCSGDILSDDIIRLSNKRPGGKKNPYTKPLRRIVVQRADHDEPLVLVSNLVEAPALEIADLYKRRWAIELWFKWIKQNLKIKKFLGRSENAVRVQILVALITYLLADRYRQLSGSRQDFYLWMAELKCTLFQRPELNYLVEKRRRRRVSDLAIRQPALAL